MLALLGGFDLKTYSPRCYVYAATDKMGRRKAEMFEQEAAARNAVQGSCIVAAPPFTTVSIPRAREVGQPWASSALTTLTALFHSLASVALYRPDLVLANGPGTCLPVCAGAAVLRVLGLAEGKVVYVESVARVYRLSLTGKILYRMRLADALFVQWEELARGHQRALYRGRLV
jgi:beta-1,4-N-acetylglucosaminyltransferase